MFYCRGTGSLPKIDDIIRIEQDVVKLMPHLKTLVGNLKLHQKCLPKGSEHKAKVNQLKDNNYTVLEIFVEIDGELCGREAAYKPGTAKPVL